MDEKWAYVRKKQRRLTEAEAASDRVGDCWDHVAFDPEHRLVLAAVVAKRYATVSHRLVGEAKARFRDRPPALVATDDYGGYPQAVRRAWGGALADFSKSFA